MKVTDVLDDLDNIDLFTQSPQKQSHSITQRNKQFTLNQTAPDQKENKPNLGNKLQGGGTQPKDAKDAKDGSGFKRKQTGIHDPRDDDVFNLKSIDELLSSPAAQGIKAQNLGNQRGQERGEKFLPEINQKGLVKKRDSFDFDFEEADALINGTGNKTDGAFKLKDSGSKE